MSVLFGERKRPKVLSKNRTPELQTFLSVKNDNVVSNNSNDTTSKQIKIPRFQPLKKNVRRISEQVRSAQQEGEMYYGRWKERDRLVHIYKEQREQFLNVIQMRRQQQQELQAALPKPTLSERHSLSSSISSRTRMTPTTTEFATIVPPSDKLNIVVDFVLISGTMGVGKTSLAHTLHQTLLLEEEFDDEFSSFHSKRVSASNENGEIDDEDDDKLSPLLYKERPPFFLKGKFEHCMWEDPNTVFFAVINDFCQQ